MSISVDIGRLDQIAGWAAGTEAPDEVPEGCGLVEGREGAFSEW